MIRTTIMKEMFEEKCPYCERIFKGSYENEIRHNSKEHIEACRNKKIKRGLSKK